MKDDIKNTPSATEDAQQNRLQANINTKPKPLNLTLAQKEEILNCFPKRNNQYFGMLASLIKHGELLTNKINPKGGVNLSDVTRKSINPKIKHLGIEVTHRPPASKLKTIHGTPSKQVRWSFYNIGGLNA